MLGFFHDGGYAMFVTLVLGALFVAASARETRRDIRLGLGALTLLSGSVGFVLGVHVSLSAAGQAGLLHAAMLGVAESLNNLVLSFALLATGITITTVRALRTPA